MSDRPSDGMRFDELRDEFDWMFEFQSRMAEHIRNDPDVHSLAGYVGKLEEQNAKLRELVRGLYKAFMHSNCYRWCGFKEPCNYILDCKCQWYDRMRELGVEVGDGTE